MAMDRTMYGKVEPSAIYQPYKITITKGSPPGCESIILFMFLTLLILRDFNALFYNFKIERWYEIISNDYGCIRAYMRPFCICN